ncbi:tRNA lysidine(34) synthetase TilS [Phenylobacterium soli]|uniref:tRNA(Ile)-lysidine synthase n=1 Tax=Phenylobacterium soli TaxID=2170551 RepID=A0A328APB7_9CAUL|nr:tRNA lysidine(34) synthetase TilS [Phenylobacterium soli]
MDLDRSVAAALDERLLRHGTRPLAVALSGGGDSLALLLAAHGWAQRAGRRLLVLTVDHGLNPQSADWTAACRARAAALGADFRALAWMGVKPAAGLPAAARAARHRLLAEAAREAGAAVILIGHTADDVLEARAMRTAGASTPEPRPWSPSPAWPEGRGVFLLRPLLAVRRAAIRDWLAARGETWIEDPSNADLRFARARARAAGGLENEAAPPRAPALQGLAGRCEMDTAGVLRLPREALRAPAAEAFVGAAALCAAGTGRPPPAARLRRLAAQLAGEAAFVATLGGARIEADEEAVRFLREPGEAARGGLANLGAAAGETVVWDGRFEITAERAMEIRPLSGLASRLPDAAREAVRGFAAKARPGLPAAVEDGAVTCLALDRARCRPLALARLHAACGLVEREPG